ncbi:DUF2239 family protein [Bradyrhizobium sp. CCH5-F6]|jgi:uncharacterized protein|uniref:DUF2239 family protein n=1 Tax=Bradyrhizobium sp. CCH5-F6 TaxID=1768753 RepID=UPI000769C67F|nr:DUF2239 family protein [Bradyrhizobium sp. CCH5-F6]
MQATFTAFVGQRRLASGTAGDVALAVKRATQPLDQPIIIFDDGTGRSIDFDLRGDDREVLARLAKLMPPPATESAEPPTEPRGRGRPKLGVVAREVTLLPRHWEWLNSQAGGASVALRKLVDEARRASGAKDRERQARDAAYHFMSTMAGDLPQFEEASRALFADDRRRFTGLIADWPTDIRDHIVKLAYSDRA